MTKNELKSLLTLTPRIYSFPIPSDPSRFFLFGLDQQSRIVNIANIVFELTNKTDPEEAVARLAQIFQLQLSHRPIDPPPQEG